MSSASKVIRRFTPPAAGGGQGADADAQLVAAPGQVVEVGDAVRQLDRMVVGQQMAERAEPDPRGPLQGLGNEEVRCRAGLPGGGEVLADPCLREAERIQPLDLFQVPVLPGRDAGFRRVRRHQQCPCLHRPHPACVPELVPGWSP